MEGFDDMAATGDELVTLKQLKRCAYFPVIARTFITKSFEGGGIWEVPINLMFTVSGLYITNTSLGGTYVLDESNYVLTYMPQNHETAEILKSENVYIEDADTYKLASSINRNANTTNIFTNLYFRYNREESFELSLSVYLVASVIGYNE